MLRHLRHPSLTALRPLTRGIGSVVAVRTERPHVVLTYDDGPQPGGTDAVLDALARRRATATFFLLVGRARTHPDLLRRIVAEGHEVALHGVDHRPLPDFSPDEVAARTQRGKDELEQLSGVPVRWARPPYGRQRLRDWRAVRSTGLEPVLWGATTLDSRDVPNDARLRSALRARAGTILLAHDGFAGPGDGVDDGPEPSLDRGALTEAILRGLRTEGIAGVSLSAALVSGTLLREAWFSR